MDKLVVSGNGYPAATEYIEFAEQSSHDQINALVTAIGNNVIVSDMVDTDGVLSDGWLIFNNEMLPFVSGALGSTITIVEEVTSSGYDINETGDFNTILPVWKKRYAKFGDPGDANVVSSFAYSILTRVDSVTELTGNKIEVKRSGQATMFYNSLNTPIVTGDFTAAEIVDQGISNVMRVKVTFPELIGDYLPFVNLNSADGGTDWVINIYHFEKTTTSFTFDISHGNQTNIINLDLFKKFDINIIQ